MHPTEAFFHQAIDLLVVHGNRVFGAQRWSWDKEGGHCLMTRPLDLDLIAAQLKVPDDVLLNCTYGYVATMREWLDLHHTLPYAPTPPEENGTEVGRCWSPWWLVHEGSADLAMWRGRVRDYLRRRSDWRLLVHTRPDGNRYVEAYWQTLTGSVFEATVPQRPAQRLWLSTWSFHTWPMRGHRFLPCAALIVPGVGREDVELQVALRSQAEAIAAALGLRLWNHQEQRLEV